MEEKNKREIREVPLSQIDPFPNHPFKVRDDNDMVNLVESIAQTGLITILLMEPSSDVLIARADILIASR